MFFFFFFNDTATTEIYTLSLHDALPISAAHHVDDARRQAGLGQQLHQEVRCQRSEEHTSELQSQSNLVCRLLLEKKKQTKKHVHSITRHINKTASARLDTTSCYESDVVP